MAEDDYSRWKRSHLDPYYSEIGDLSPDEFRRLYQNTYPSLAGVPAKVTEEALVSIAEVIIANVMQKNADYGDAWQALGKVGAAARFVDKMFRIEHLANGQEALVLDEKFEDTVADLVGYGLLILLYKRVRG